MSIAEFKPDTGRDAPHGAPCPPQEARPLHNIREVRKQQGVSLRSAARRMQLDVAEVRALEDEHSDMLLSALYQWQDALEVPVANLLVEDGDALSEPVLKRARMVRLMKTAAAILEKADNKPLERMATMLVEQLVELMPELAEVSPWHAVGQRRSLDEMGRIAEQPLPDDWFFTNGC